MRYSIKFGLKPTVKREHNKDLDTSKCEAEMPNKLQSPDV